MYIRSCYSKGMFFGATPRLPQRIDMALRSTHLPVPGGWTRGHAVVVVLKGRGFVHIVHDVKVAHLIVLGRSRKRQREFGDRHRSSHHTFSY